MASDALIGDIMMVGFNFAPIGWMLCNGQTLNIADYEALYLVIGTTYGGDGVNTFKLPDLRGRVPIGPSPATPYSFQGGQEQASISTAELPSHSHSMKATNNTGSVSTPLGKNLAKVSNAIYIPPSTPSATAPSTTDGPGLGTPHANVQPYLSINFVIAVEGIFPRMN